MIKKEIAEKYHLPPIEEYPFPEADWYHTFLIQTDYVANKIAESIYLGEELDEDYAEIINARKECRAKINELQEEKKGK